MRMINYLVLGQDQRVTLAVLQAIRSFTDAGCMVIGGRANRGLRWSSLCEQQAELRFDGSDDERLVDLVNDMTRYTRHMVLIPADAEAIRMVNRLGSRLAVAVTPVPDTPTLTMLGDLWRFQRLCRQHGLPVPACRLIGGEAEPDFPALAGELGLPFLVRPAAVSDKDAPILVRCKRDLWRIPARGLLVAQSLSEGVDAALCVLADRGQLTSLAIEGLNQEQLARLQPELERLAARLCHVCAFNGVMRLAIKADPDTGSVTLMHCVPHFWPELTSTILAGLNPVAETVQPSPRRLTGPRVVSQAVAVVPHPLAPSQWGRLRAQDEVGRLLRAMSLDLYSLSISTGHALRRAIASPARQSRPARSPALLPAPAITARHDAAAG